MAICSPSSAFQWSQNAWPWMTLAVYFALNSVFAPVWLAETVRIRKIIAWKLIKIGTIGTYCQRCKSLVAEILASATQLKSTKYVALLCINSIRPTKTKRLLDTYIMLSVTRYMQQSTWRLDTSFTGQDSELHVLSVDLDRPSWQNSNEFSTRWLWAESRKPYSMTGLSN